MPTLRRPAVLPRAHRVRVVVIGDLVLDVVLAPARAIETGTDVPGRVILRQGGSAATTARWAARLGAAATLACAVGRDPVGRSLIAAVRADGVDVRAARLSGLRTGRIGVLLAPTGERSFVADRGAADALRPEDLREAWFTRAAIVHLPFYSLVGEPIGRAGLRAVELARSAGALVSLDLASIGPLLASGRRTARELVRDVAPDLLFATAAEADAFVGRPYPEGLLEIAAVAVVKRGAGGATVLARDGESRRRFEVATPHVDAADTTGAGDAFDAGFIVAWLGARSAGRSSAVGLRQAAIAGHRAAARQLTGPRPELILG